MNELQCAVPGHAQYVLGLGDDALISAQRLSWWISRAPELEEDVALANIGLDQLGQARALLSHAGELDGSGRDEDALAYFRDEREFLNVTLVERPQTDFAVTMARLLIYSAWRLELYADLRGSTDGQLAAIAAKGIKETAYHFDHARLWVLRLGDGTELSHRRMQDAIDAEWPYLPELFGTEHLTSEVLEAGIAADPTTLVEPVTNRLSATIREATLSTPDSPAAVTAGRRGIHTEHLGYLLAELQHVARSHPGVVW